MRKDNGVTDWKISSIILLILLVGTIIYFNLNPLEVKIIEEIQIQEEPKSLISTTFDQWGGELGRTNGYIFQYWINNFGDVEAKDVIVECVVIDQNDNIIRRITKNSGNIASNSMKFDEIYEDILGDTSNFDAYCLTKSCSSGCEILEHNIPEVAKYLQ